jgi:motility quorum-sensing regulator/GCU-specific mRNA interferase toxin
MSISMDKFKAHYSLLKIKQLAKAENYKITATARKTAFEDFSLLENEIIDVILSLEITDLYKSMTSHNDSTLWHDVYLKRIMNTTAYIKLQILDENSIIISFKEK